MCYAIMSRNVFITFPMMAEFGKYLFSVVDTFIFILIIGLNIIIIFQYSNFHLSFHFISKYINNTSMLAMNNF